MNLTIEKAKEIVKHYLKTDEPMKGDIHGSDMATGFIEGWNKAIDEIIFKFDMKPIIYSSEAMLLKEIKELKVNGESK